MKTSLVLTCIGPDRPGLVGSLSQVVADHDGNWVESHMARLAGKFAGLLRVEIPAERADELTRALGALGADGFRITVEPTELLLPPGTHEVTARLAGHASHTQNIFLIPRQKLGAEFFLEVRNTARFQEQLAGALHEPASQRHSGIWRALDLALTNIDAAAVLTASYDGDTEVLHVGLFFPRRQGWAYYRSVRLGGPDRRAEVDSAIEDLLMTVDRILHPQVIDEVASR